MKVLVTGGAGFLGSHVADTLSSAKHDVTILDKKQSKYLRSDQQMVLGDILDHEHLNSVLSGKDVVYHFAGIADIDECAKRPVDTVKYNILGTVQLLEACVRSNVKRFVFASSSYVYSKSGSFYRCSKQSSELFIENYAELYGIKYTCLRYGSLYGDRADEHNSIYRIIKQAIETKEITYHGTGEETREYIHVRDASHLSVKILEPEYENQYIILAGTEKIKYKELLVMISEILGSDINVKMLPSERNAHYIITPYSFSPKLGRKLINNAHIDMGQGLLYCMNEIYKQVNKEKHKEMGLIIDDYK